MSNLKPLGDRIIVRRSESVEKTAGGIVLPDAAKQKPQKGKVLAVGPGKLLKNGGRRAPQVKEGDTVVFTSWAGDEFQEGTGSAILVMREEDVLAVVEGYSGKNQLERVSEIDWEARWLQSRLRLMRKLGKRCVGVWPSWLGRSK